MIDQTEIQWRGRRIVQTDYARTSEFENYGFNVKQVFKVLDDFDDPALPISQQVFWSPGDAVSAIYCMDEIAPQIIGKKWPSTALHEYNQMLSYRSHFGYVYDSLIKVKKMCREAKEWGDNPADAVLSELARLHQVITTQRGGIR